MPWEDNKKSTVNINFLRESKRAANAGCSSI